MKAEQRKEIETNSLVLAVQKLRERMTGRTLYYLIGTAAVVIGAILLYRYFTGERSKTRDAGLMQLVNANTPEKLKQGIEDHRGTFLGSVFKLQLARHYLLDEGLPKLGTDNFEDQKKAANSVAEARTYYLDLTTELKQEDHAALLQEAWHSAAQAEEALVAYPTAPGGTDSRGSADKVIEYYDKAAAVFPDSEPSKRDKARADQIRADKDQFVATKREIYKPRETVPFPPGTGQGAGGLLPGLPRTGSDFPKIEPPPAPKSSTPATSTTTTTTPPPPAPPPAPEPKKTPDSKAPETPKVDPKAK